MCERTASANPRSRRSQGDGAPGFSMWGGNTVSNFMSRPSHGAELRRQGVTCRGRRASGGPRRGGGGEGPWRQPRASRLGLGVSGSSMATRRRRATRLTPHFQIKMAQAPGLGREPLPPTSCLKACPQKSGKTPEEREHPSWKGLGGRAWAWGGAFSGGGQRGNHA